VTPPLNSSTTLVASASSTPKVPRKTPALSTPLQQRLSSSGQDTPSASTVFEPASVVAEFLASDSSQLDLPISLTSTQRQEIHELAKHFNLKHKSSGNGSERFLTIAKRGVIIGECSLRKSLASELILQGAESQRIPTLTNVACVLAAAPLPISDSYDVDAQPKRKRGRPPKSSKSTVDPVSTESDVEPTKRYSTRSQQK
jgi:hypothetical protein